MPNIINEKMLVEYSQSLEGVEGGVFVDFTGIDVALINELRTRFHEKDIPFQVVKNRVVRKAFREAGFDLEMDELLAGPTAMAYGDAERAIGAAKVIEEASKKKEFKALRVKGGFFENSVLDEAGVKTLATLPDRPTMQSMILSAILGPGRGIATSINAVMSGLARCIQGRIDQAGEPAAEA